MKIWETLGEARQDLTNTVSAVTIGNFDGVHRGHQMIIRSTIESARQISGQAIVVSFSNHTDAIVGERPPLLNQPVIRQELLSELGVDGLLVIEFNREFAELTPEIFFEEWLVKGLKTQAVVVGYDFKFGAAGRGDYQLLQQLCNPKDIVHKQIPAVREDGQIISSSMIRQLITAGKIELANKMLGYHYQIVGTVAHGEQRGRTLGFPTANIQLAPHYLLPAYGVYLVEFMVGDKTFSGVAGVGVKPTFGIYAPLIEVYVLDTEQDFYNKAVKVRFLKFLRAETQFSDAAALKKQIAADVQRARMYLRETTVS